MTSLGDGIGGNITIDTGTLTALENSDITANSPNFRGGNVIIDAQGIFGTQFREVTTPESDITASGREGRPELSGTVEINSLETDVENNLTPLEANFISPEQLIAGSCLARRNERQGSFVVTGTGGLPTTPDSNTQEYDSLTANEAPPAETSLSEPVEAEPTQPKWKPGDPIVEATALVRTNDGEIMLVAQQSELQGADKLVCVTEKSR